MESNNDQSTPVLIRLESVIDHGDNQIDRTNLDTTGDLIRKNDTLYLRYNEAIEGAGTISNTIKVKDAEASVIRQGPISMRQALRVGETTHGSYQNPHGRMATTAKAIKIDANWHPTSSRGNISLIYQLDMQGQPVGRCTLIYHIQEARHDDC